MEIIANNVAIELYEVYGFIASNISEFREIIFSGVDLTLEYKKIIELSQNNIEEYIRNKIEEHRIIELLDSIMAIKGGTKGFRFLNNYLLDHEIIVPYEDVFKIVQDDKLKKVLQYFEYNYSLQIESKTPPFTEDSLISQAVDEIINSKYTSFSLDPLKDYLSIIGKYKNLTKQQFYDLFKEYKNGSKEAKEKLINHNLRLVIKPAVRASIMCSGMSVLDIIQEGNLGLMKALERFDPEKDNRFSTYALYWIRQAIGRGIDDQSRAIRIPVHASQKIKKINRFYGEFFTTHGRFPTDKEVSEELNISVEKIKELRNDERILNADSLDRSVGDDDETPLGYFVKDDEDDNPEAYAIRQRAREEQITAFSKCLTAREEKILRLRIGYDDDKPKTLEEIGAMFGLTRERIRQLENKAIRKLQSYYRSQSAEQRIKAIQNKKDPSKLYTLARNLDKSKYEVEGYTGDYALVKIKCKKCNTTAWYDYDDLYYGIKCKNCILERKDNESNINNDRSEKNMFREPLEEQLGVTKEVLEMFLNAFDKQDVKLIRKQEKSSLEGYDLHRVYYLKKVLKEDISFFDINGNKVKTKSAVDIFKLDRDVVMKIAQKKLSEDDIYTIFHPRIVNESELVEFIGLIRILNHSILLYKARHNVGKKTESVKEKKDIYAMVDTSMSQEVIQELIKRLSHTDKLIIEKRENGSLTYDERMCFSRIIQKLKFRVSCVRAQQVYSDDINLRRIAKVLNLDYENMFNSLPKKMQRIITKYEKKLVITDKDKEAFLEAAEVLKIRMGIYDGRNKKSVRKTIYDRINQNPELIDKALESLSERELDIVFKSSIAPLSQKEWAEYTNIINKIELKIKKMSVGLTVNHINSQKESVSELAELSKKDPEVAEVVDSLCDSIQGKEAVHYGVSQMSDEEEIDTLYIEEEVTSEKNIVVGEKAEVVEEINYREEFYRGYYEQLLQIIQDPAIMFIVTPLNLRITCDRIGLGVEAHISSEVAAYYRISEEEVERISKETLIKLNNYMMTIIKSHIDTQTARLRKPLEENKNNNE